jgi:hypothetical protein
MSVINALLTPGIPSLIASKLDSTDRGISSLFLLLNDVRFRHELQPYIEVLYILNEETKIKARNEIRCKRITRKILKHLRRCASLSTDVQRAHRVIITFFYICNCGDDMYLLGKRLARTMDERLTILYEQSLGNNGVSFLIPYLNEFRTKLNDYFEWGYQ